VQGGGGGSDREGGREGGEKLEKKEGCFFHGRNGAGTAVAKG
jgi:hypothetical protein